MQLQRPSKEAPEDPSDAAAELPEKASGDPRECCCGGKASGGKASGVRCKNIVTASKSFFRLLVWIAKKWLRLDREPAYFTIFNRFKHFRNSIF